MPKTEKKSRIEEEAPDALNDNVEDLADKTSGFKNRVNNFDPPSSGGLGFNVLGKTAGFLTVATAG